MSIQNQSDRENAPRTVEDIIGEINKKTADGDYIFRGESQCIQNPDRENVIQSGLWGIRELYREGQ